MKCLGPNCVFSSTGAILCPDDLIARLLFPMACKLSLCTKSPLLLCPFLCGLMSERSSTVVSENYYISVGCVGWAGRIERASLNQISLLTGKLLGKLCVFADGCCSAVIKSLPRFILVCQKV